MKIRLLIAAVIAAIGSAWAAPAATQTATAQAPIAVPAPNTVDSVRQAARSDKRGLVEKNMQLSAAEAQRFWPIYDDYQRELDKIVSRQNRALTDYVNAESRMTDKNAKRIADEILAADADEARLRAKTLRKVSSALSPKKGVRFMQIENKIRTLQRFDVAEQMPLVQ